MATAKIQGNPLGSGSVTLAAPNTNSDFTLTLPAENGALLSTATPGVPVNGPAFSANQGSAQTLSAGTYTKLVFGTELFDTNNCFDSTTNYRFTPTVAGYYVLSAGCYINQTGVKIVQLYKNGAVLCELGRNASGSDSTLSGSATVYANGSTDYFEIYGLSTVLASAGVGTLPELKWFTGAMVRAA